MKAKIKTDGFVFSNLNFGIGRDRFDIIDNVLIIESWNGMYRFENFFEHTPSLHIWVPLQYGTYTGPWNGLGYIYGLDLNIVEVSDIYSSLTEGACLTEVEYLALRMKRTLEIQHAINPQFTPYISTYTELLDQKKSIDEEITIYHDKFLLCNT